MLLMDSGEYSDICLKYCHKQWNSKKILEDYNSSFFGKYSYCRKYKMYDTAD